MLLSARRNAFGSVVRAGAILALLAPLACAVAIEPELKDDGEGGSGSVGKAGSPPIVSAGTSSNAFGGTGSMPSGGAAGSTTSAGQGGGSSSAGKGGGASSGGKGTGGQGGLANGGTSQGGTSQGGTMSSGCGALKAWKGGDPTLTIAAGEVVQWMGKRYKATAAIAYPNAECAPDAPEMWCANWFTPDGTC